MDKMQSKIIVSTTLSVRCFFHTFQYLIIAHCLCFPNCVKQLMAGRYGGQT